ncbi:MAG: hypothetical protein IJ418_21910 [Clostridia bacterium]|nr:hypothetical protein [Clostridia bacterium]
MSGQIGLAAPLVLKPALCAALPARYFISHMTKTELTKHQILVSSVG